MEQRKAIRYQVRAPVLFRWTDVDGVGLQGGGFSRDISTDGLFVCCGRLPPLKTALSIEVLLSVAQAPGPGLWLRGQGEVVRVEGRENQPGFAAKAHLDLTRSETDLS